MRRLGGARPPEFPVSRGSPARRFARGVTHLTSAVLRDDRVIVPEARLGAFTDNLAAHTLGAVLSEAFVSENDFRDVSIEDTRLLLGLNAIECYDLDVEGLTEIASRIGPTPEQLNQDPNLRTPDDAIRKARWWFDDYGMEWRD